MEYETTNHVIVKNPPWWERRTNLERRVMVISCILFVIGVALVIGLAIVLLLKQENEFYPYPYDEYEMEQLREHPNLLRETDSVCLAPGCIHAASTILKYMDRTVNPCEDFYHFACGGFLNETNVPGGKVSIDPFSFSYDLLQEQLRTVIEEPPKLQTVRPFSLIKKLYDVCMDTTTVETHSLITIKNLISSLGGWPVIEKYSWDEQHFDWKDTIFKFRRVGFDVNSFITVEVVTDLHNVSRNIFIIDQAQLGPEEHILVRGLDDERVRAYYSYMLDVAIQFGADWEFAANEIKATIELEIALAKIANMREIEATMHHSISVAELQKRFPNLAWRNYLNGIIDVPDLPVSYDDQVILRNPQYLIELEKLLTWTAKRVQANYLMWRAVKSSVQFLTEQLKNRRFDYFSAAFGITEKTSRWKECVHVVTKGIPFAVGSLYVHKYVEENTREIIFEMVANIRNQFMELLKLVNWMDDVTKMNALDKADALTVRTAYSDEFLSVKRLQEYYAELDFTSENYLACILTLNLFERDKYFEKLKRFNRFDRDEDMYTTTVQPYYEAAKNVLNIPSGILQEPFFSVERPQFLNYGALGYIIGHEIAHSIDSTGRHFDKNGNVVDWWTEYTKKAFTQHSHCISSNYMNRTYNLPELDLYNDDDESTRECNVADNGGIKAAYLAYNIWVERFGHEYQIPSLNYYTPLQLFWIAAAQTKCTKYRPEYLKDEGFAEPFTPAYYKVYGTLSNNDFFARDFHCRLGSTMNPGRKCHVW